MSKQDKATMAKIEASDSFGEEYVTFVKDKRVPPLLNDPNLVSEGEIYLREEYTAPSDILTYEQLREEARDRLRGLRHAERHIGRLEKKVRTSRDTVKRLQAVALKTTYLAGRYKFAVNKARSVSSGVHAVNKDDQELGAKMQALEVENAGLKEKIAALEAKLELAELHTARKKGALCIVCYQQAPDAVFKPCRHLNMCYRCYMENGPYDCPKCGTPIEQVYLLSTV